MTKVKVAGGHIHYEVFGAGPPIVIIRGLSRSLRHWLGFAEFLGERFQVISFDNRGIGLSDCEAPWNLTMEMMAQDICSILDDMGLDAAHILGVSLGGMIAMALGITAPERCLSLTLINSSVGGQRQFRLKPRAALKLLKAGLSPGRINEALVELLVSPTLPAPERDSMRAAWLEIIASEGVPYLTTIKQLLAAGRFCAAEGLRQLKVPTLIVYGTDDAFVPNHNSHIIHRLIPGAKLEKLEDAGHEAMTDKPTELRAAIVSFIENLPPRSA